jgi:hypothetical protein
MKRRQHYEKPSVKRKRGFVLVAIVVGVLLGLWIKRGRR